MAKSYLDNMREKTPLYEIRNYVKYRNDLSETSSRRRYNILMIYVRQSYGDDKKFIRKLLNKCPELLHMVDKKGHNVLHYCYNIEIFWYLLKRGAVITKIEKLLNHFAAFWRITQSSLSRFLECIKGIPIYRGYDFISKRLTYPQCTDAEIAIIINNGFEIHQHNSRMVLNAVRHRCFGFMCYLRYLGYNLFWNLYNNWNFYEYLSLYAPLDVIEFFLECGLDPHAKFAGCYITDRCASRDIKLAEPFIRRGGVIEFTETLEKHGDKIQGMYHEPKYVLGLKQQCINFIRRPLIIKRPFKDPIKVPMSLMNETEWKSKERLYDFLKMLKN